ncbi:MAG: DUF4126 domain-containing protein [Phycisphaeraceae bacterium]
MNGSELMLALAAGVGLAAACGFRVFTPLLVMSLAARAGHLSLAGNAEWLGSDLALLALGTATALEIAAFYVPWVDNALDTVATPAAAIAGTVAASSMLVGMDPALQWTLGAIAGGGTALTVQSLTVGTRAVSSLTTGGLGNPVVATTEAGASAGLALLAVLLPLLAMGLVVLLVLVLARYVVRRWRFRRARAAAA